MLYDRIIMRDKFEELHETDTVYMGWEGQHGMTVNAKKFQLVICTDRQIKVGKKQKSDERPLKPHIEDVGAELSDFFMFTKENTVHKDFSPCNKTNYDLTLQKHWTRSSEFQHQQKLSSESTKIVSEPWEDANGRISDKTEKSKLKKRRLRRAEYFVDLLLKEFNRRKQYSKYENNSVSFCGSYQDTSSFSKSIAADTATHNKPDVGTKSGQFVNKEHNVIHLRKCCQYYRCQVHSNERNVSNEKEICAKAQENLMTHILEDRNINKYSKKNMPVNISLNDSVTECNLTKCAGSACDICQCLINEAEFLFSDEDDSSY